MAKPSSKSAQVEAALERISMSLYGRSRLDCIRNNTCVMCGSAAKEFRDELSRKEFSISGMCQKCQDETFGSTLREGAMDFCMDCGRKLQNWLWKYCPSCYQKRMKKREAEGVKG